VYNRSALVKLPSQMGRSHLIIVCGCTALLLACSARGQDNYEIQVYGSDTVPKGNTMFELHSNFTFEGSKTVINGVYPTQDALHETLEITHGWTNNFETGFYIFTSFQHSQGYQYVGSHIRPRWSAPESWHLPVGVSISLEAGWQKNTFSEDTWSLEIRPIIDKQIGKSYFAFNPALEKSLAGVNAGRGYEFSPNVKYSYDITGKITLGIEYYGSFGPTTDFDPWSVQQHQIFPSVDLNMGKEWEFNVGAGWGLTPSTDRFILKMIIGRRFSS
jgi:hypothetical protein